jgi:hypothetical protein
VSGEFSSGFHFSSVIRHASQIPLRASFRYSKRPSTLCYDKQFAGCVHGYQFSYHGDFTTFFYDGFKIATVPASKHPTDTADLRAFDDSASASVDLVDEFFGLLEMCGEITLKVLGKWLWLTTKRYRTAYLS